MRLILVETMLKIILKFYNKKNIEFIELKKLIKK